MRTTDQDLSKAADTLVNTGMDVKELWKYIPDVALVIAEEREATVQRFIAVADKLEAEQGSYQGNIARRMAAAYIRQAAREET